MSKRYYLFFAILIGLVPVAYSQSGNPFSPTIFAAPTEVRSADGRPGPLYWQQRADYKIQVSLDTVWHRISGNEVIYYTNNSPFPLDYIWLQLDQNVLKPGSLGSMEYNSPFGRWSGGFKQGGDSLGDVIVVQEGKAYRPKSFVNDTRMRIELERPLKPNGGKVEVRINWKFNIPLFGVSRMGALKTEKGWIYEIAQWYPRLAVYDDVHGWNTLPYLGQGEFYLEYGDFDVSITVPRNLIVVATGVLKNPAAVLTRAEINRLAQALKTDSTIHIISESEVGDIHTRPTGTGNLTWKFHASNVRDFSWAASRAFIWDASHWDNILLMAVYPKEGVAVDSLKEKSPGWEKVVQFMRHTFKFYSEHYYHYPYPVATNVGGIVGGMEYPMIVFCSVKSRGQALYFVTDHEFGHSWFPMTVGSDERRYPWMDEGINTFINFYSNDDYYGKSSVENRLMTADTIAHWMKSDWNNQPIMTYADQIVPMRLGFLAYRKPAFGLRLLKEIILAPGEFDNAFRTYIRNWAFKHPQPSDFFRTIENYTGEDLSWFWNGWFYSTHVLDQSVDSVKTDTTHTLIYLSNRRGLVMPAIVKVTYESGKEQEFKLPVEIWFLGDKYTMRLNEHEIVKEVVLDPNHELPDVDRSNNEWILKK